MNPVQGPFPTTPWEEPNVHLCTRTRRDVVRGIHIYIYIHTRGASPRRADARPRLRAVAKTRTGM